MTKKNVLMKRLARFLSQLIKDWIIVPLFALPVASQAISITRGPHNMHHTYEPFVIFGAVVVGIMIYGGIFDEWKEDDS